MNRRFDVFDVYEINHDNVYQLDTSVRPITVFERHDNNTSHMVTNINVAFVVKCVLHHRMQNVTVLYVLSFTNLHLMWYDTIPPHIVLTQFHQFHNARVFWGWVGEDEHFLHIRRSQQHAHAFANMTPYVNDVVVLDVNTTIIRVHHLFHDCYVVLTLYDGDYYGALTGHGLHGMRTATVRREMTFGGLYCIFTSPALPLNVSVRMNMMF